MNIGNYYANMELNRMKNKTSETKVKTIILTLLYMNKGKKYTARELSSWINNHKYGIQERITPQRVSALLRDRHGNCFIRVIESDHSYDSFYKNSVTHYWVEK